MLSENEIKRIMVLLGDTMSRVDRLMQEKSISKSDATKIVGAELFMGRSKTWPVVGASNKVYPVSDLSES